MSKMSFLAGAGNMTSAMASATVIDEDMPVRDLNALTQPRGDAAINAVTSAHPNTSSAVIPQGILSGQREIVVVDAAAVVDAEFGPTSGPATLAIQDVAPSDFNAREEFTDEDIQELADSILSVGRLIQRIAVRPIEPRFHQAMGAGESWQVFRRNNTGEVLPIRTFLGPDAETKAIDLAAILSAARYQIVAGERRWWACRRTELLTIDVEIFDHDDLKAAEVMVIENGKRKDISPWEEMRGFQRLAALGLSQAEIGRRTGYSQSRISKRIALAKLPPQIGEMVRDRSIDASAADRLQSFAAFPEVQIALANAIKGRSIKIADIDGNLSYNAAFLLKQNPKLARQLDWSCGFDYAKICPKCPFNAYRNGSYDLCFKPDHFVELQREAKAAEKVKNATAGQLSSEATAAMERARSAFRSAGSDVPEPSAQPAPERPAAYTQLPVVNDLTAAQESVSTDEGREALIAHLARTLLQIAFARGAENVIPSGPIKWIPDAASLAGDEVETPADALAATAPKIPTWSQINVGFSTNARVVVLMRDEDHNPNGSEYVTHDGFQRFQRPTGCTGECPCRGLAVCDNPQLGAKSVSGEPEVLLLCTDIPRFDKLRKEEKERQNEAHIAAVWAETSAFVDKLHDPDMLLKAAALVGGEAIPYWTDKGGAERLPEFASRFGIDLDPSTFVLENSGRSTRLDKEVAFAGRSIEDCIRLAAITIILRDSVSRAAGYHSTASKHIRDCFASGCSSSGDVSKGVSPPSATSTVTPLPANGSTQDSFPEIDYWLKGFPARPDRFPIIIGVSADLLERAQGMADFGQVTMHGKLTRTLIHGGQRFAVTGLEAHPGYELASLIAVFSLSDPRVATIPVWRNGQSEGPEQCRNHGRIATCGGEEVVLVGPRIHIFRDREGLEGSFAEARAEHEENYARYLATMAERNVPPTAAVAKEAAPADKCLNCGADVFITDEGQGDLLPGYETLPNGVYKFPNGDILTPQCAVYCAACANAGLPICRSCGCTDKAGCEPDEKGLSCMWIGKEMQNPLGRQCSRCFDREIDAKYAVGVAGAQESNIA